jgi:hypothetical protein
MTCLVTLDIPLRGIFKPAPKPGMPYTRAIAGNFIQDSTIITKQNDKHDRTESKCRYKTWDNDSGPHHYDIAKSHGQRSYEARGKDQGSW